MPFSDRSYDPETVALMTGALDEAGRESEKRGIVVELGPTDARTSMALRIKAAVDEGVREREDLIRVALGVIDSEGGIISQ